MYKMRFEAAKEFIIEKKYDDARAILKTIDGPLARKWEAKLEELDPTFLSFEGAESVSGGGNANRKRLGISLGVVLLIVVAIGLVAILSTGQPDAQGHQATLEAVSIAQNATSVTETPAASNTPLPSATPTFAGSYYDYYLMNQTETYKAIMGTVDANLATSTTFYIEIPTMTFTPSNTPTATLPVTPLAATIYYAYEFSYLGSCPHNTLKCFQATDTREVERGDAVQVVGVIEGDVSSIGTNKWFQIQFTDGDKRTYYQLVEYFSPNPPGKNDQSPLLTQRRITPTATRHP